MPYYINTGMFEGVRTRFSFLLPILEPDYVADQIVQGILENSNAVHLPTIVNLNHFTKFFFPTWFCDALADFLGLNNTYVTLLLIFQKIRKSFSIYHSLLEWMNLLEENN